MKAGDEELHRFDFLLTEVRNKYSPEMRLYEQTHQKVELIDCFSNIGLHYESLLPIKIRTKPCIMILRKKKDGVLIKNLVYDETIIVDENESALDEQQELDVDELLEKWDSFDDSSADEIAMEEEKEEISNKIDDKQEEQSPKFKKIRKRKLMKPLENPKQKIKDIIEAEKPQVQSASEQPKSNIKKIIKEEKTREFIEELSKMDLSKFCDLDKMTAKDCLKKIIEEKEIWNSA